MSKFSYRLQKNLAHTVQYTHLPHKQKGASTYAYILAHSIEAAVQLQERFWIQNCKWI